MRNRGHGSSNSFSEPKDPKGPRIGAYKLAGLWPHEHLRAVYFVHFWINCLPLSSFIITTYYKILQYLRKMIIMILLVPSLDYLE